MNKLQIASLIVGIIDVYSPLALIIKSKPIVTIFPFRRLTVFSQSTFVTKPHYDHPNCYQ
ncbi:hypothetical protein EDC31_10623 [Acidomonas methanolica]|nr:hypothetical protein EDC31_10623 [Acidomonas methanolica]